mmetsp:Transcript_126429/g.369408  ORF Transcript_126429/g.369408 Transcript_126429/m.369408 type:complete len:508 (+) Transcript_126429:64-1587(+)
MPESRDLAAEAIRGSNGSVPPHLTAEKNDHVREGVFFEGFGFIDWPATKVFISIIVFLNILELAAETDFPQFGAWLLIDSGFMIFYLVELTLHIGYRGVWFFIGKDHWWSILDVGLIILGIVDLWILTPVFGWHSQEMEELRLLRLFRAIRIFKLLPKLTQFLNALLSMLMAFVWVFLVLFLFLLASAMFLNHLVKRDAILDQVPESTLSAEEKAASEAQFQNVLVSIFTLFRVVTQDNWNHIAWPLTTSDPIMRLFFVVFIAFASWTLISVLTGVASDEMIAATTNRKELERLEQERRQKAFIEFLRKSFYDADSDGNGLLDKEEFEDMMQDPGMQQTMSSMGLDMTIDQLSKAWTMLDCDGHGELTIDDFVEGLSYLHETLSVKHIISIDYSVKRTAIRLEKCLDHLLEELVQVGRQCELILGFLIDQDDIRDQLSEQLNVWRVWAAMAAPSAVCRARREQGKNIIRQCRPKPLSPLNSPRISMPTEDYSVNRPSQDGKLEKEAT